MDQYIINEQPRPDGAYEMHNLSKGCENLPVQKEQIPIGFFANFELAYKRARINWPKEKVKACVSCCHINNN